MSDRISKSTTLSFPSVILRSVDCSSVWIFSQPLFVYDDVMSDRLRGSVCLPNARVDQRKGLLGLGPRVLKLASMVARPAYTCARMSESRPHDGPASSFKSAGHLTITV